METRTCKHCNEDKPLTSFVKDRHREHKNGNTYVDKSYVCYQCLNVKYGHANKAWRERNKPHMKKLYMYNDAKKRAEAKGLDFTITADDIVIPDVCPLLGVAIDTTTTKAGGSANSPSLDRKDSTKGYTPDNVWVVSHKANTIKNSATWEEIMLVAENLKKHTT